MAHTITETPSFDLNIVVPDGTDSRADAAEKVAAIAQKLANRTQSMKLVTDVAAKTNVTNTFTAPNTFSATTTMAAAVINGNISAADGTVNVSGSLAVSSAVQSGSLTVTGPATIDGAISASDGTVNVTGNLGVASDVAGASLTTSGNVNLSSNVGDVVYTSASLPLRYVNIPLYLGKLISANGSYDTLFDTWGLTAAAGVAVIRFAVPPVPRGSAAIGLEAVWRAHDVAAANSATLRMNAQAAWDSTAGTLVGPTDPEDLITLDQTAGFSSTQCVRSGLFLPALHTVDNAGEAYFIDVHLVDGPNNRLFGLRAYFLDPGARNG